MKGKNILPVLKQTVSEWSEDQVPMLGAALAYYTVFSLAPLLILSIAISGFVLGQEAAQGQIFAQMHSLLGDEGAAALQEMVQSASAQPTTGIIAAVTGIVTLVFGAAGVFGQLQASLNIIWGVKLKPGLGIKGMVRNRLLSFSFILVVCFILLVSLLLSAAITFATKWIGLSSDLGCLAYTADFVISLAINTLLFGLIFKYLPDAQVDWRDVGTGAFLTALLFLLGKFGLGLYLGASSVGSSFGAAGSLIVLLVWVYYSAQILFFGAEFTQVYANQCGKPIIPSKNAVLADEHSSSEEKSDANG